MTTRVALTALLVALASRASAAPEAFRCEARGGSPWREYRTAHFLVDTDLSRDEAQGLAHELEQLQALELQALLGEQVDIPGRLRVVAFRDPRQFRELAGADVRAYYLPNAFDQAIVLQSEGLRVAPETVAHELAHHLSWFLFPHQARWFTEGLAQFVETAAKPRRAELAVTGTHLVRAGAEGSGGRWIGLAPAAMAKAIRVVPLVEAEDLLTWRGSISHAEPSRFHLSSWLLYHYLWNKRSAELTEYQRRLSDGASPLEAWRAAFPGYDPDRPASLQPLDAELERYRRGGRFLAYAVALPNVEVTASERPLPSAEVHMLIARARRAWPERRVDAQALLAADVDEALREDAAQPLAIVERSRLDAAASPPAMARDAIRAAAAARRAPIGALRAAVARRPDDWRGWYLLGRALEEPAEVKEREACYRKAIALEPDAGVAQSNLASLLVESGRAREALPFANRAVDLAPWNPQFVDTLAVVANELGHCPQALRLARRALDELPPGSEAAHEVERHLGAFERRCGTPAATSAAPLPERP